MIRCGAIAVSSVMTDKHRMRRRKHKARKRRSATDLAECGYTLPPRWWVGRDRDLGEVVINALRHQRAWMDS
jgi:hypothetical protein